MAVACKGSVIKPSTEGTLAVHTLGPAVVQRYKGAVCPLELAQNIKHNHLHRQVTAPLCAAGLSYSEKKQTKRRKKM